MESVAIMMAMLITTMLNTMRPCLTNSVVDAAASYSIEGISCSWVDSKLFKKRLRMQLTRISQP